MQERVQKLSHKILQLKPKYTMHYQELIEHELRGENIEMSRRPIVGQAKNVISENGQKGFVINQPFEEEILQRWQGRKFSEAEELSAVQWRQSIEENTIDLEKIDLSESIKALKNLNEIVDMRDAQKDEGQESWTLQHHQYPPEIESSFTSDLWKAHIPYSSRKSVDSERTRTPEENKKLVEMLNRLANSPDNTDHGGPFKDQETDFVVIKSKVGPDDFCPCGSGKLFKDCHLPEVRKNQNT